MMNELTYHREGDFLIPDLIPPEIPRIGIWGMRRREFLRKHHSGICTGLLFSGKLNAHLVEIDRSAIKMFDILIMKAQDQIEWARRMNSIRKRVEEAIYAELISDCDQKVLDQ